MTTSLTGPWDLLVVGGGTAGIVGATTAAALGARVLLVERDRTGGDCLWTGCVPSKSLLAAAAAAATARGSGPLGVHADAVRVDFAAVRAHIRAAITAIEPDDAPDTLRAAGVVVAAGSARLTGPRTATVTLDGGAGAPAEVVFASALLATGAAPAVPPLSGSGGPPVLTSETVWDLAGLPGALVVLGGGGIGCELAQAYARLGSAVTVVEAGDRLLAGEDPAAAAVVADALRADGVRVLTGVRARSLAPGRVVLDDGNGLAADAVLAAVGRSPRTAGLGLAAAGIGVDDAGAVVVDGHLRTTNPRVFAAGDVTGYPHFTHVAGAHGSLAAANAVLGLRRRVDPVTPRVTFTDPELAAVGDTLRTDGVRVRTTPHRHVDRAVTEGRTAGFTRLHTDRRGRLVAATVVGPRAGETLGELSLAVSKRLRLRELAATTHAYPTFDDAVRDLGVEGLRETLAGPVARTVLGAVVGVRRRWLSRGGPARRSG